MPDDETSSTIRMRYKRRVDSLATAGYRVESGHAEAPAGDTWEIVRVVGRGTRGAGLIVRASARFVEAYRRAQDSRAYELVPSSRLFLPQRP